MRESDADGDADLRAGTELASDVAVGFVEIPYFVYSFFQSVGGEHPVLVFDGVPDLERQPAGGHRRGIPILSCLLLPAGAGFSMAFRNGLKSTCNLAALGCVNRQPFCNQISQRRQLVQPP